MFAAISAAGVLRHDDTGNSWHEVSGDLPSNLGFAIGVHEPDTVYVVPITTDSEHHPPRGGCGFTGVAAAGSGGRSVPALPKSTPTSTCFAPR